MQGSRRPSRDRVRERAVTRQIAQRQKQSGSKPVVSALQGCHESGNFPAPPTAQREGFAGSGASRELHGKDEVCSANENPETVDPRPGRCTRGCEDSVMGAGAVG